MKALLIFLIANLIIPSSVWAAQCGVLDFGNDVAWEYRDGVFLNIDGKKISVAVPAKRKASKKNTIAVTTIQVIGSSKSKRNPPALQFLIKPFKGKTIQATKKSRNLIALFENSSNLLLLNIANGDVFRANIQNSLIRKKIVFILDEDASFYPDDCSDRD